MKTNFVNEGENENEPLQDANYVSLYLLCGWENNLKKNEKKNHLFS